MHGIFFAGGFGQRLWPISRRNKPKQFTSLMGEKSFLRLAMERVEGIISPEDIYISTNIKFADLIRSQVPEISMDHLILEPQKRDLAAAAAFAFFSLWKKGVRGPIYFQWSDNYVGNVQGLKNLIAAGKQLVMENPRRIVFIGQEPRYASENLGWIQHGAEIGKIDAIPYYRYESWNYRPTPETCRKMFESKEYVWNCGYFLSSMEFIIDSYRSLAPEYASIAEAIVALDASAGNDKLLELYERFPVAHFDDAFLKRVNPEDAVILKADLGWADPGTLYGLKEVLQDSPTGNVIKSENTNIVELDCLDGLFVNMDVKPMAVFGLEGVIVINTKDVLLVVAKDKVRHMDELMKLLQKQGFDDLL